MLIDGIFVHGFGPVSEIPGDWILERERDIHEDFDEPSRITGAYYSLAPNFRVCLIYHTQVYPVSSLRIVMF